MGSVGSLKGATRAYQARRNGRGAAAGHRDAKRISPKCGFDATKSGPECESILRSRRLR
jgi:hypothetical protein